jgi:predicted RNA-binding protein associated with RNAse of E/G family
VSLFTADLIVADDRSIVMSLELDRSEPLIFRDQVVIDAGYRAVWFLFKERGYDIAAVYRPDGGLTGYYVDVLEPVIWQDADPGTLAPVVDLFLDLWIAPDGSFEVLDEDEFDEAVAKEWINGDQRGHALRVLDELRQSVVAGTFPPQEVRERAHNI